MADDLNGGLSPVWFFPAAQVFLNDSDDRQFFLSLPEEKQQELLNSEGDFHENLKILREKQ